jgi:pimeloyl-ACP methyl ester carboxylesterase
MELRPGRPGALIDSDDGVVLTSAPPGATVTIEAHLELGGQQWRCSGEYVADPDGTVDTARHASGGGSYRGVDPFGLFWSADLERRHDWSLLPPLTVTLRASSDDLVVESSYSRPIVHPRVTEHAVQEDGVAGRLFLPPEGGGARAVVLLAGSEGGAGVPLMGALLAGHGLTALSLAHWKFPGVPDVLRDIDVEVVGRGCDWVRALPNVADQPPAVIGLSRGGELALLAASLTPGKVGPVVSVVGSGVPWGAWGDGTDVLETAWRFAGEPVPQMVEDENDPDACIDDTDMVAAAEIPIERATGPVLLISGENDGLWPSARLSRIAEDRARREGAGDKVVHVAYPDAGHQAGLPPGFPMPSVFNADEFTLRPGGSRTGNHAARVDGWRRILEHVEAPYR